MRSLFVFLRTAVLGLTVVALPVDAAEKPTVRRVNLALNKPASASSEEANKENFAAKAFDGSTDSRWCANGESTNEWLQVDLGAPTKLTGVRIAWESDDVPYFHRVESSENGKDWRVLTDASTNTKRGPDAHDFKADNVRFVRVAYLGKTGGGWGSITEFEVFGDKTETLDPKQARAQADQKLLGEVKVPEGFEATLFAAPPLANYPVFVAATPDGTVYISSDGNGSLGRDPHRGRVLRLRDLDWDGRADESKEFVKDVDSPRGLVWDHDRLYLLHPPHLSVFIDKDGDGVSDEQKILVKNIAFGFKDRPADHTSNGIELGIDGWIYCAIGDFGFMEAEGTDGRKLQLRGGGVVRVRPDGSGLQIYSRGTRNILEVAVSPTLDLVERDNTNDGDGWDVRLHHNTPLANHGYPSHYKNFSDEMVPPLADYGGGSGCGGAWIDEPGIPAKWNNAPFTCDWGRNWVYQHRLTPKGATFTAQQAEFVGLTRVTDLDVDAMSRVYVASWKGATFNWAGPDVGYLVRLSPKNYRAEVLPDFAKASEEILFREMESASHRRRLEAQRTLLRSKITPAMAGKLSTLARDEQKPIGSRVAAIFAIKQGLGVKATPLLVELSKVPAIREFAVRALADRAEENAAVPAEPIIAALRDTNPRARLQAAFAVAQLGSEQNAAALAYLLGDADPVVAHTTVEALKVLQADDACFAVLDATDSTAAKRSGAIKVLQSLHQEKVVAGLTSRLDREKDPQRRQGLITALCRLHSREGQWKGESWGTRPDTTGPYYATESWSETPKIAHVLQQTLNTASSAEAAHLLAEFNRHKIQSAEAVSKVIALASKDSALVPAAVGQLARADRVPPEALPLLTEAASTKQTNEAVRSRAVVALTKMPQPEAVRTALAALPSLEKGAQPGTDKDRRSARDAFFNSTNVENQQAVLIEATSTEATAALAFATLLKISERKNASPEAREATRSFLEKSWNNPKSKAALLRGIQLAEVRSYKDKVLSALNDSDAQVAAAAKATASALRFDRETNKNDGGAISVATLQPAQVIAAVSKTKGEVKLGEQLYTQQGCNACHTVRSDEPQRGPFLGTIAATYKRAELTEAILVPNKSIAQGFVANRFEMQDGQEHEGFVTLEAADKIVIRSIASQEITLIPNEIVKREKIEKSLMPEGLAATLTVRELASLIDYLESLSKNQSAAK